MSQPESGGRDALARSVFTRTQLPFAAGVALLGGAALLIDQAAASRPELIAGLGVTALVTLVAAALPWQRLGVRRLVWVATADLVAVALLHHALASEYPLVGLLAVIPIVWIGYGSAGRFVVVAVVGAVVIACLPFVAAGSAPQTPEAWVNTAALPVMSVLIAFSVQAAARRLANLGSQRNRLHEELRRSFADLERRDRRFSALGQAVDAGLIFLDADGRVVRTNEMASRLLELESGTHVDSGGARPGPLGRAIATLQPSPDLEWVGPAAESRAITVSVTTVRAEDDPHGEIIGTVIAAYDVTDLALAVQARDHFLATVSHELRTPLTSITGYLEVVREELPPERPELQGHLDVIERNVDRLTRRVADLLGAQGGEVAVTLKDLEISGLVGRLCDEERGRVERKGLTLRGEVEPGIWAHVDPPRYRQIVENLLSNAIKFSAEGGEIRISLARLDGEAVLEVANPGVPISPADQRQLFDRFFRTASSRQQAVEGLGLGLWIVRQLAAAMGGAVSVRSDEAATVFTVRVPSMP